MAQQQEKNVRPRQRPLLTAMDLIGFAALPLELLLHELRSFGVRAVGPKATAAVLVMFLFVAFHPGDNLMPLTVFMVAVIPFSIIAHVSAKIRLRQGVTLHSRYNGRPRLMRLLPFSEITVKRLEAPLAFIISFAIRAVNHPVGDYLMASAAALALITGQRHLADSTRALDLNDSVIEQKIAAEKVRNTLR